MDTTVVWSGISFAICPGIMGCNICRHFFNVLSGVPLCSNAGIDQEETLVEF